MAKRDRQSQRQRRERQKKAKRAQTTIMLGVAAIVVALMGFVFWQQTAGSDTLPAADVPDPLIGPADAPVTITEYADFGCPACRSWHNAGIREQIQATFGDQVRFVWKDFPVITAYSPKAAEAGHCAGEQDRFWAFHDYVYEQNNDITESGLKRSAAAVGLDQEQFAACLDSNRMAAKVQAGDNEARRLGFRSTPAFAVNGKPLAAPPNYQQLAQEVEMALRP